MTATKKQTVRYARLHAVEGSNPAVMMTRDGAFVASQYQSGMWQLEGPNGLSTVCATKRALKKAVHDAQVAPVSPRRRRASKKA